MLAEPFLSRFAPAHHNCRRGPWGPHSSPSHISKMVLASVHVGPLDRTRTQALGRLASACYQHWRSSRRLYSLVDNCSWSTARCRLSARDRLHERQPRTQRSVGGPLPCQGNGAGLAPLRPGTSTAAPVSLSPSGRPGKLRLEVGLAAAGRLRQPGWLGCGVRRQPAACQESVAACSSCLVRLWDEAILHASRLVPGVAGLAAAHRG